MSKNELLDDLTFVEVFDPVYKYQRKIPLEWEVGQIEIPEPSPEHNGYGVVTEHQALLFLPIRISSNQEHRWRCIFYNYRFRSFRRHSLHRRPNQIHPRTTQTLIPA